MKKISKVNKICLYIMFGIAIITILYTNCYATILDDTISFSEDTSDCYEILETILDDLQLIFDWLKIIAPILVIAFGSFDFAKAIISNDNDLLKKASSKFAKRLIAAVLLFFLPFLVNLVLAMPGVGPSGNGITDAVCGIGMVVNSLW